MPSVRTLIFIFMTLLFSVNFVYDICYLLKSFPNNYVWGEVFIKYTDGFIRRGLIGTVLYILSDFVSVKIFWVSFVSLIYLVFFIKFYKLLRENVSCFFTIVLFFSPALAAFMVYDHYLFGRKDILILSLLFVIMSLSAKMIRQQQASLRDWLPVPCCCALALLIHEIVLFFSVFPAMLFIAANKRNKARIAITFLIVCACSLLAISCSGTTDVRDTMFLDWHAVVDDFHEPGGMAYIGMSLSQNIAFTRVALASPALCIVHVSAWVLSLAPVLLFVYVYNFHAINIRVVGKGIAWMGYLLAVCSVIILMNIINDFGRIISYSLLMFVCYAMFVIDIYKNTYGELPTKACLETLKFENRRILVYSLCYLCCWKLEHTIVQLLQIGLLSWLKLG